MINESNSPFNLALNRRQLLKAGGAAGASLAAGGLLAGCGGGNLSVTVGAGDPNVLNFALNLEYLEAEYYLRAVTGQGLTATDAGTGAGVVTGGAKVPFQTTIYQQIATEIAQDELNHVRFLRNLLLTSAVPRPNIDFAASFALFATNAGLGGTFNPFNDEVSFLLGAFVFEDLGVSAYHGSLTSLTSSTNLVSASGILGTEAYHAGAIRTLINQIGGSATTSANALAAYRGTVDGSNNTDDSGATVNGLPAIADVNANSIAFSRTTAQVLKVVYIGQTTGGFFPNGLNGAVH